MLFFIFIFLGAKFSSQASLRGSVTLSLSDRLCRRSGTERTFTPEPEKAQHKKGSGSQNPEPDRTVKIAESKGQNRKGRFQRDKKHPGKNCSRLTFCSPAQAQKLPCKGKHQKKLQHRKHKEHEKRLPAVVYEKPERQVKAHKRKKKVQKAFQTEFKAVFRPQNIENKKQKRHCKIENPLKDKKNGKACPLIVRKKNTEFKDGTQGKTA